MSAKTAPANQGLFAGLVSNNSGLLISSSIIMILTIMIIPIPTVFLDLLFALSISLSIIVLLVAFFALRPLDFAVFPGMLLMLTLFRLSLNVASTRLILSEGYAGEMIQAFGNFMVQGNIVIGIIIFLILVIINFVVITKGAGRIAEVSARFTLDAMPGKQMAIDADLNAGLLTDKEALRRREEIAREADFYGAMDGASKFVRGDVVASILITIINIVGGLIVGTAQMGMSLAEAAETFTLLTVGDGLVSQIPSLLISTGAGIIITRAAGEVSLGTEITGQLFGDPKVLAISSGFIFLMGLLPGMPILPFFLIAGYLLFQASKSHNKKREETEIEQQKSIQDSTPKQKVEDYLLVDTLVIEIGYSLIPLVDPRQGGDLMDRITSLRNQMAIELGIVIPPVRIRDNIELEANGYEIRMRGITIASGQVVPDYFMIILPGDIELDIPGMPGKDPAFGMDALWISERNRGLAERNGLSVIEPSAVVITHLMEVLKKNAYRLIDREMVNRLIDHLKENTPAVVEELIPAKMSVGEVQKILRRLLKEQVPVRDLSTILETVADNLVNTKNPDVLVEYVRGALAETITQAYKNRDNQIHALILDPKLEGRLIQLAQQGKLHPDSLGLDPDEMEQFFEKTTLGFEKLISEGHQPVIVTSPVLRQAVYDFLVQTHPQIAVLSYNDLTLNIQIVNAGSVAMASEPSGLVGSPSSRF
jgi:flagellar biosynthesis protein FlhA